jgi:hypothetical protein
MAMLGHSALPPQTMNDDVDDHARPRVKGIAEITVAMALRLLSAGHRLTEWPCSATQCGAIAMAMLGHEWCQSVQQ